MNGERIEVYEATTESHLRCRWIFYSIPLKCPDWFWHSVRTSRAAPYPQASAVYCAASQRRAGRVMSQPNRKDARSITCMR
jgi:hypothetical protein